jgi:hypothetical protein
VRLQLQHFVDALSFDENPVEYLMNRFPEARMKPEVGHVGAVKCFSEACVKPEIGHVGAKKTLSWSLHEARGLSCWCSKKRFPEACVKAEVGHVGAARTSAGSTMKRLKRGQACSSKLRLNSMNIREMCDVCPKASRNRCMTWTEVIVCQRSKIAQQQFLLTRRDKG